MDKVHGWSVKYSTCLWVQTIVTVEKMIELLSAIIKY